MNKKFVFAIIIFNLIWSVSALLYDGKVILQIPFYFWPFLIICPIFPFILAIVWYQIYDKNKPNYWLLSLGGIASVTYFLAALIYYPTWMFQNGFDLLAFGQILWVAAYGIQGLYLIIQYDTKKIAVLLTTLFLMLSFVVQWKTETIGYLDFTNISSRTITGEYLCLSLLLLFLSGYVFLRKSQNNSGQ